ncbi:YcxB family protein [Lachnospiraceae bacterium ZAX-1]
MPIEFDIKITSKDMYRFNMYHAYTGFHGIFATVFGIAVIVVACVTVETVETMYTMLYLLFGCIFMVYMPISLLLRSKRQVLASPALRETLHYRVDGKGVHVSQNGQTATLEWKQVYRVRATKSNLLIYSSRVNAYVIPRVAIGGKFEEVAKLAKTKLEKYRIKI